MTALWEALTTCINAIFGFFTKYPLYGLVTDLENATLANSGRYYSAIDMIFMNFPGRLEFDAGNSRYILYATYEQFTNLVDNPISSFNVLTITLFGVAIIFTLVALFKRLVKSST